MYSLTAPTLAIGPYGYITVSPKAVIRPRLTVSRIREVVTAYYNLSSIALVSARRSREVARPRQIAMYLAKQLTPKSLPVIGREFNRDHTTVIHAIKQIERLKIIDGDIADDIVTLRAKLAA